MSIPNQRTYLAPLSELLRTFWPENRAVNIVCHGHSVPAGYFATPMVDSLNAYPHLLFEGLKQRFPYCVVNVIVTAVGGEDALTGAPRFTPDALCHRPDLVIIDYGLNDRRSGLEKAGEAWRRMIEEALGANARLLLCTPTWDITCLQTEKDGGREVLGRHAEQIRMLAAEYSLGLADSFFAFETYVETGDLADLLSWSNHPNRKGHELVARELLRWFPAG